MPRRTLLLSALLCLLATFGFDECEAPVHFVFIDGPETETFTEAQTVTITATAVSQEGLTVKEVRFYYDDSERPTHTDTTAPYSYRWPITASDNGTHRFHAKADYEWQGGQETLQSEEVVYRVAIAPPTGDACEGNTADVRAITGLGTITSIAMDPTGDLAAIASSTGLTIVDLTDPARPRIAGSVDLIHKERGVAIGGDTAFIVEVGSNVTLAAVDLSVPSDPRLMGRIDLPGIVSGRGIEVVGNFAYVAASNAGLQIIDISNPRSPVIVSSAATGKSADVAVDGGYAFVGTTGSTSAPIHIVDARNPRSPLVVAEWRKIHSGLAARGDRLVAFSKGGAFGLYDVSVPASRTLLKGASFGVNDAVFPDDCLFVGNRWGISRVDLSDPSTLEQERFLDLPEVRILAAAGGLLLAGDTTGTLSVIAISR